VCVWGGGGLSLPGQLQRHSTPECTHTSMHPTPPHPTTHRNTRPACYLTHFLTTHTATTTRRSPQGSHTPTPHHKQLNAPSPPNLTGGKSARRMLHMIYKLQKSKLGLYKLHSLASILNLFSGALSQHHFPTRVRPNLTWPHLNVSTHGTC
jgi:hypothetical protein